MIRKIISGLFGVVLLVLGISCVIKFIELITIYPDGGGIGVYFYGIEINDKVPATEISTYAISFLGAGVLSLLIVGYLTLSVLAKKIEKNSYWNSKKEGK